MPLLIIGLFLLIGILIYAIYNYIKPDGDSDRSLSQSSDTGSRKGRRNGEKDSSILYFPDQSEVEIEKRKRDI